MLDRMAPDGIWYDSTTTAESEEPIGYIVKILPKHNTPPFPLDEHWNAYFRGEALFVNDGPNVKFASEWAAKHAVEWKFFDERNQAQKVAQTYDWQLDSNN
jgi:hypothetical protein